MEKNILLISDTHGNIPIDLAVLGGDVLFHAGDIGDYSTFSKFASFKDVYAVKGNTDLFQDDDVPDFITLSIDGVRIFIVHNLAAPHRIISANSRIISDFKPDLVFFGHTHIPLIEEKDGILFVNPGSLGKRGMTGFHSCAKIKISSGSILSAIILDIENNAEVIQWQKPEK